MKQAFCEAMFPELKGPSIYKTGKGEGTNAVIAAQRALRHALRQVKGKRVTIIKASITISESASVEELTVSERYDMGEFNGPAK
jgi:hypothetical protein